MKRTGRDTPDQHSSAMELETVNAVNAMLLKREVTEAQAEAMVKAEVKRLRDELKPKPITATINHEILQRFWDKAYKHKPNRSPESAYNRLLRAVNALGGLPLPTASAGEIQERLASNLSNNSTLRDSIAATRQLLRFIGRPDVYIHKPIKKRRSIKYLTLEDFKKTLPFIPSDLHPLYWATIGTGGRAAEVFAMEKYWAERKAVFIETTLDKDMEDGPTKTGDVRWAPVITETIPYLIQWCNTPTEFRESIRKMRFAEILTEACTKAKVARIVFRDLRHSYAIHLLTNKIPLEQVARALGNSLSVCQANYVGFVLLTPELDHFKNI